MFLMVSSAYANGENPFRASAAKAGGGVQGGGGDAKTELRIKEIRDDIFNWINQGGAKGLQFNHGLTLDDYLNGNETKGVYGMKDILISGAVVINAIKSNEQNLSDPELNTHVDGKPKTCKGFISQKDSRPTIICEVERFWELNEQEQYKQIHHEYAGLGLLEKNSGSDSDYDLSNQITKNLKYITKLMLVVESKPKFISPNMDCRVEGLEKNFYSDWIKKSIEKYLNEKNYSIHFVSSYTSGAKRITLEHDIDYLYSQLLYIPSDIKKPQKKFKNNGHISGLVIESASLNIQDELYDYYRKTFSYKNIKLNKSEILSAGTLDNDDADYIRKEMLIDKLIKKLIKNLKRCE